MTHHNNCHTNPLPASRPPLRLLSLNLALQATDTGVTDAHIVGNGAGRGIFDTIICVLVLCSVPALEQTSRAA